MLDDNNSVVIKDSQENPAENESSENNDFSPEEKAMAEKHKVDLKVEPGPDEEKSEIKKETENAKLSEDDYDTFDKVHDLYEHHKDAFYSLPKSIKNQYHNAKGLFKRVKDEEEKRKKIEDDSGYMKLKDSVARAKLNKLASRIALAKKDPEGNGLTVEELEQLIDFQDAIEEQDNSDRPVTVKDLERMKQKEYEEFNKSAEAKRLQQENVQNRIVESEAFAKANIADITDGKYDNFNDVIFLANEVVRTKKRFAQQIAEVINSEEPIEEIVDTIVSIAKINPKYGTTKSQKQIDVERMEKNSQKTKTSASIATGKGGRAISYDDLTPEDADKLTIEQWGKIPREVRRRILMETK
jgi:hypothetical protein